MIIPISKTTRATIRLAVSGLLVWALSFCGKAQNTNFDFQATRIAADRGDAGAQYQLGQCYATGKGVDRDYRKAAQYLQKAAEQGNPNAEIVLGSFYGRGLGVPRSIAMAVQWYRKAAEEGNALAQFAMGNFYASGRGVSNDMTQAIQWWQKSAAQNQAEAQAALGQLYLVPSREHGTNYVNYSEAMHWLREAATNGSAVAMNNLGVAYQSGLAVKLDLVEAAKWFRMAAERGESQAQANLGESYFDGSGVAIDLVQAYKWFKLSATQGNNLGIIGLNNFQTHQLLKPQQLAEAEQMVLDFKPIGITNQQ